MKNLYNITHKLDSKRYIVLGILFVLALGIRLYFTIDEFNDHGTSKWSDAILYLDHGRQFAAGDFYPAYGRFNYTIVGPVIPLLVAGSKLLFGDPIWPMLILNCLLSAALVFVLFKLGEKLVSVPAGYFMALWGIANINMARYNYQIYKEPLVFILLPLILLCLLNLRANKRKTWYLIGSSLLFSLLIHTDERYFIYAPLLILFILFSGKIRESWKNAILWLLILIASMVPWTVRNFHQHDQLVILTPRTTAITSKFWGDDLVELHFTKADGFSNSPNYDKAIEKAIRIGEKEGVPYRKYGSFEKYWRAFIHYWKPAYFKLTFIQYGFRGIKWSLAHNLISIIFYGIFLPFYLAGAILALFRRNWLMIFMAALPFLNSLVHTVLIWPLARYRLPMDFLIVIVALWFIKELYSYHKLRRQSAVHS